MHQQFAEWFTRCTIVLFSQSTGRRNV